MNARIVRRWFTPRSTSGQWYLDHVFQCFTLEDPTRTDPVPATAENEAKVPGATCIPPGRYRLMLRRPSRLIWSPRPDRALLHLEDVPGFTGIFVHALNRAEETEGCIGVGNVRTPDWIGSSRAALRGLHAALDPVLATGEPVWCQIEAFPLPDPGASMLDSDVA